MFVLILLSFGIVSGLFRHLFDKDRGLFLRLSDNILGLGLGLLDSVSCQLFRFEYLFDYFFHVPTPIRLYMEPLLNTMRGFMRLPPYDYTCNIGYILHKFCARIKELLTFCLTIPDRLLRIILTIIP